MMPLSRRAATFASSLVLSALIAAPAIAKPTAADVGARPVAAAPVQATANSAVEHFRAALAPYGVFRTHARYGEVWSPSPELVGAGWSPYPECRWVFEPQSAQFAYNDPTPWGMVVHRFGRWLNDSEMGWIWIADETPGPGWVHWRVDGQRVSWAPLTPQAGEEPSDGWRSQDLARFATGCGEPSRAASAQPAAPSAPAAALQPQPPGPPPGAPAYQPPAYAPPAYQRPIAQAPAYQPPAQPAYAAPSYARPAYIPAPAGPVYLPLPSPVLVGVPPVMVPGGRPPVLVPSLPPRMPPATTPQAPGNRPTPPGSPTPAPGSPTPPPGSATPAPGSTTPSQPPGGAAQAPRPGSSMVGAALLLCQARPVECQSTVHPPQSTPAQRPNGGGFTGSLTATANPPPQGRPAGGGSRGLVESICRELPALPQCTILTGLGVFRHAPNGLAHRPGLPGRPLAGLQRPAFARHPLANRPMFRPRPNVFAQTRAPLTGRPFATPLRPNPSLARPAHRPMPQFARPAYRPMPSLARRTVPGFRTPAAAFRPMVRPTPAVRPYAMPRANLAARPMMRAFPRPMMRPAAARFARR